MDEKSLNKTIRNAIKLGGMKEVKRLIGDNPESLHTMTQFGTWLHVADRAGKLDMMTSNMLPTVLTIISCLIKTAKHVSNPWKDVQWEELKEEWRKFKPIVYRKSIR